MQWFRFYSEALDDPKVQRLPGDLFKAWVNLLCLANEQDERGTLPLLDDITFRLRLDHQKAEDALTGLRRAGLLDYNADTDEYRIHAWDKRQYASDNSTDRVRKFRDKQRETADETGRNKRGTFQKRSSNAIEQNRVDTDTDTEQSQKQSTGRATRATPAPDIFPVSAEMRDWATTNAPGVDVDLQTQRFLDRNRAEGKSYKDWPAAWRNWITSPYAKAPARPTSRAPDVQSVNGVAMSPRMARNLRVLQETEL